MSGTDAHKGVSVNSEAIVVSTQTRHAPANAVKAQGLSISIGRTGLLSDANLVIAAQVRTVERETLRGELLQVEGGTCYGLVGPNGCGKSTLLNLVAERRLPVPCKWRVHLVGQHLPEASGHTPKEEVLSGDAELAKLLCERDRLEAEIESDACDVQATSEELNRVYDELCHWEEAEAEVSKILVGLGFRDGELSEGREPTLTQPMCELSGGWRMKVQLAKALWLKPELLLLDEPTNHLDFHALLWLEEYLQTYPNTIVVVSHNSCFLQGACDIILRISGQKIERVPQASISAQALSAMQQSESGRPLSFKFHAAAGRPEDNGLSFHHVEFSYNPHGPGPPLLRDIHCNVLRFSGRSRSVLLGRNGAGKSTVLSLCLGKSLPCKGSVDRDPSVKIGHYSQHFTEELDRHPDETAASYLVRECRQALIALARRSDEQRLLETARKVLSQFGLQGDVAGSIPIRGLSGGQKARVNFAFLAIQPWHMLFLDEPTNHLDAGASEALVEALVSFKGGVVLVSHDELLIERLLHSAAHSELIICEGGGVRRERDMGVYRRRALHDQVARAEAAAAVVAKRQESAREANRKRRSRGPAPGSSAAKQPAEPSAASTGTAGAASGDRLAAYFAARKSVKSKKANVAMTQVLSLPTPSQKQVDEPAGGKRQSAPAPAQGPSLDPSLSHMPVMSPPGQAPLKSSTACHAQLDHLPGGKASLSPEQKEARKLKKALREIEALEAQRDVGERLRPNQIQKISMKEDYILQLSRIDAKGV